jgi:hypothetical protein
MKTNCDQEVIKKQMTKFEQTLGLLDASFAHLSILYPTDEEKERAREAVTALSKNSREVG